MFGPNSELSDTGEFLPALLALSAAPRNQFFQGVGLPQSGMNTPQRLLPSVQAYANSGLARFGIGSGYRPQPYTPQNFMAPGLAALRVRAQEPVAPITDPIADSGGGGPGTGPGNGPGGGTPDGPGGVSSGIDTSISTPTPTDPGILGLISFVSPTLGKAITALDKAQQEAAISNALNGTGLAVGNTPGTANGVDSPTAGAPGGIGNTAGTTGPSGTPSLGPDAQAAIEGMIGMAAFAADPPSIGMSGAAPGTASSSAAANAAAAAADAAANMGIDADAAAAAAAAVGSDGSGNGDSASADGGGDYAMGGRPPVGKVSVVGEKGKELFVPDVPGTIIPHNIYMQLLKHTMSGRR